MSLLAPLYALGLLAITAPLIFHLIQRRPGKEYEFGSLIFLQPTPPRLTRRSRLNQVLLLLLRGMALLLLAFAFARPFIRSFWQTPQTQMGKRVVVAVDVSASMRREDLWQQTRQQVDAIVNEIGPTDVVSLITFAQSAQVVVPFEDQRNSAESNPTHIRDALSQIEPGWEATNLTEALSLCADSILSQQASLETEKGQHLGHAIIVSDFQEGGANLLQAFAWPEQLSLELRPVRCQQDSNASLTELRDPDNPEVDATKLQVRVSNSARSGQQRFQLSTIGEEQGQPSDSAIAIEIPPGQSRALSIPLRPDSNQLQLSGDPHDFDNRLFFVARKPRDKSLLYLGQEPAADPTTALFFLRRADLSTAFTHVTLTETPINDLASAPDVSAVPLVVVVESWSSAPTAAALAEYVQQGGNLLLVLDDQVEGWHAAVKTLLPDESVRFTPAQPDDYLMWGAVDFTHPLFTPFADSRFNDFTKIRVWKYRQALLGDGSTARTIVRFENGDPALLEWSLGQGTIWAMCSGWSVADSQLALSTKFLPLLSRFMSQREVEDEPLSYTVGSPVSVPTGKGDIRVLGPDGSTFTIADDVGEFKDTHVPGIYEVQCDDPAAGFAFAVNTAPIESRTRPLDQAELEQLGIAPGQFSDLADVRNRERQMKDVELESAQRLWQWLILAALACIGLEMALSGKLSRMANVAPV